MKTFTATATSVLMSIALLLGQGSQAANEALWQAAREGDTAGITAAPTRGRRRQRQIAYDVTPLIFATGTTGSRRWRCLLARGANVNAQDTFYQMRAIDMAMTNNHPAVVTLLLQGGFADGRLAWPRQFNEGVPIIAAALASSELTGSQGQHALAGAKKANSRGKSRADREEAGRDAGPPRASWRDVDPATLQSYVGSYRNEDAGAATVALNGDQLTFASRRNRRRDAQRDLADQLPRRRTRRPRINFEDRGGTIDRSRRDVLNNTPQVWTRVAAHRLARLRPAALRQRPRRLLRRRPADTKPANHGQLAAQLAGVPRRQRLRQRRRTRRRGRVGRRRERTSAGRPPIPGISRPARSSGATACSSRPPSAAPATRRSAPGSTATSRR